MVTKQEEATSPIARSKEELRNSVFAKEHTEVKSIPININGVDLEWRVPSLLQTQRLDSEGKNMIVVMLIKYSYIPGTNELMFEDSDYDRFIDMPVNGSINKVITTIAKALDLGVDEKVKN